jgi:hypothetical protein
MHKIVIEEKPLAKHKMKPFVMSCSCGTEGGFANLGEARAYAQLHAERQSGMNTFSLVDKTLAPTPSETRSNLPPYATTTVAGEAALQPYAAKVN